MNIHRSKGQKELIGQSLSNMASTVHKNSMIEGRAFSDREAKVSQLKACCCKSEIFH